MNDRLLKYNILTAALIVVVLFVSFCFSLFSYSRLDFNLYDNDLRILLAGQKNDAERGIYGKGDFPCIVFDLEGKVLYSEEAFPYRIGEVLNIQEMLQFDKSFAAGNASDIKESFVLQQDGKTTGFAVFLVPIDRVVKNSGEKAALKAFLPIGLGIFAGLVILLIRTFYFNQCVLKPLKEISRSAKGMIAGDYDLEVIRTYEKKIGENEIGDLTYSFELMRDELKSKQLREEALKKSQQELISCISHDLKTPISTIKAYSEGLRDGIAKTPEGREEYVRIIIGKTDLLIGMINELLEYSNAQLNQLEINAKEIYFYEYFYPLMKELEGLVRQKGMEFSYTVNTPDMLLCMDAKRITEVLYNLVENSMKYIRDKRGEITIEAERDEEHVRIKVIDNGIGISPDDIPYVFEKFYRAEKSRSSSIPGSGLGLSICKYIVEQHGGEIYCKSRYNRGCEFGFTLSAFHLLPEETDGKEKYHDRVSNYP